MSSGWGVKQSRRRTLALFFPSLHTRHGSRNAQSPVPHNLQTVSVPFALLQKEDKPTLYVFNAVTQETMAIKENMSILDRKVSDLRTLVTLSCGFPVSVYCLRTPAGLEMYDCNTLKDYQTNIGTARHISRQLLPGLFYTRFCSFSRGDGNLGFYVQILGLIYLP